MSAEKRVIKKYPNRRLYDTATSCYITLTDVKQLVLEGIDLQVADAKTGEDITRSVLLQIIMEEEAGGMPLFSYEVLTQIIRFYGNAMQGLMGNYLEKNLQLFAEMQTRLQDQAKHALNGENPMLGNANLWGEFMKFQGPALQSMMGNYLESSTNLFVDMQQQLQDRAKHLFTGFGMPGYAKPTEPQPGEPQPSTPPTGVQEPSPAPAKAPRKRSS
ncbi:polyhydroxyalkanoate synthesis repressor PhaR [Andreprevotia lacus DSM 23236]|jgi:polyhydroxyalkanoate synthesis repressor PhaR|uniref:Polyhydroxyalkanoate synthesis repressor PhaR n=1 Tax=Andreprevotia lacus DSM 23236 TaxID=1121001 RepID=A0A1W1X5P5_9NEIS|nr:polyhydroxyalkanoate synthesis repressor PhaR [Andreprevotia lacus]SMC19264.1 polyhydroxyalkanoate synthesis repressor PhaR [Andreprevotia lacus DSM 23236]